MFSIDTLYCILFCEHKNKKIMGYDQRCVSHFGLAKNPFAPDKFMTMFLTTQLYVPGGYRTT